MNSFIFSAITICLAAQCALAQYNNMQYNQRKMAPSPQAYGQQQQGGYGAGSEMSGYGHEQQSDYNRVPSSASVSTYDERVPLGNGNGNNYNNGQKSSGYGKQQQGYVAQQAAASSGYGQQAAGYSKASPKYEEQYHAPMPFAWGYDINDGYGGAQYHKENGDEYGKRTGSYGYTDAYGVYRQVDYVADEHGFRATIKTNEPGTANESPADVELHAYEPPSNYYAGNKDNSYSSGKSSNYAQQSTNSYNSAPVAATYTPSSYGSGSGNGNKGGYSGNNNNNYQQQRGHGHQQQSSGYQQPARQSYQQSEQYSSSVIVPVYQKAGKALAAVPAKRY